jgi:hypothetical protein
MGCHVLPAVTASSFDKNQNLGSRLLPGLSWLDRLLEQAIDGAQAMVLKLQLTFIEVSMLARMKLCAG